MGDTPYVLWVLLLFPQKTAWAGVVEDSLTSNRVGRGLHRLRPPLGFQRKAQPPKGQRSVAAFVSHVGMPHVEAIVFGEEGLQDPVVA